MSNIRIEGSRPNATVDRLREELADWKNRFSSLGDDSVSASAGLQRERAIAQADSSRLTFELEVSNEAGSILDEMITKLISSHNVMASFLESQGYSLEYGERIELIDSALVERVSFSADVKVSAPSVNCGSIMGDATSLTGTASAQYVWDPASSGSFVAGSVHNANSQP